jgi:membrane protein
MARLREVSFVVQKIGLVGFLKKIVHEINDDAVMTMGAAVAFYWLLAIFPFILFLAAIPSLLPVETQVNIKQTVHDWATTSLNANLAATINDNVNYALSQPKGGLLGLGLALTLWAASNGMSATMAALDRCYDVNKPRNYFHQRGVAILLTVISVVILFTVTLLLPVATQALNVFQKHFTEYAPTWMSGPLLPILNVLRYCVGVTLVVLLVSAIYQFGVSVRRRWTLITPGAVFCVLTIIVLASCFNLYLQKFGEASYAKTYGALGGVIILLLMFYFYAVVFLIGAEINSEIDYEVLGSKNDEAQDPLPKLFLTEDLEKFRRQLERRQARQ